MSLISEALKEAQRERSGRIPQRQPSAVNEILFPYPASRTRRANNRALVLGGAVAVLLVVGVLVGVRTWRSARSVPAAPRTAVIPATRITPVPVAPVASTDSTASAPKTAAVSRVASKPVAAAASPAAVAPHQSTVVDSPKPGGSTAPPVSVPSAVAQKAQRDSVVPPSAIPAPLPRAAKDAGVRVVVDPTGIRSGDTLFARAYAEHARGNLEAAADLYEKALTKRPVSPELYNNYGALLAARGNQDAALAMYKLGIEANPADPRLWTNLGDSYRMLGRRADALSTYGQAAKLDPSNAAVKVRLAAEYFAIGDTATARRTYEDAVRTAPKDPEARYAYGVFLASQRDYRGAARELQQFLDVAPGHMSQDVIDRTRAYVTSLRRQYP